MNAETRQRLRQLAELLSELGVPHPPLERFKLASRLWRLLAGFSREDQKQLLREFGLQEATHLEQLAEGRTVSMPATFLEFIERRARALTPDRVSLLVTALAEGETANQVEPPAEAGPEQDDTRSELPIEALDSEVGPHVSGEENGLPGNEPDVPENTASSTAERSSSVGAPVSTRQASESPPPLPPSGLKHGEAEKGRESQEPEPAPAASSGRESPGREATPTPRSRDEKVPHPPLPSRSESLIGRCARLNSTWKRRRFWLEVIRGGFEAGQAIAMLEAISTSDLAPQDYVWVVDEMATRGLLPKDLFDQAVELAPSENAARLLSRRLPLLTRESRR